MILKPYRGAQLNLAHPLARGLVGCWLFNEGTGDKAFDLSLNGNDGALTNMDPATDWVGGKDGWALDFDGVDDYILVPDREVLANTLGLTVEMWFNPDILLSVDGNVYRALEKGDTYFFLQGNGSTIGTGGQNFLVKRAGTGYFAEIGQPLDANRWYHLVGTFDGNDIRVYLDAVLKDTTNVGGAIDDDNLDLRIGSDDSGKYFDGKVSITRIWNRALTASEILQLHINPYQMFDDAISPGIFGTLAANLATLDFGWSYGQYKTKIKASTPQETWSYGNFGFFWEASAAGSIVSHLMRGR